MTVTQGVYTTPDPESSGNAEFSSEHFSVNRSKTTASENEGVDSPAFDSLIGSSGSLRVPPWLVKPLVHDRYATLILHAQEARYDQGNRQQISFQAAGLD